MIEASHTINQVPVLNAIKGIEARYVLGDGAVRGACQHVATDLIKQLKRSAINRRAQWLLGYSKAVATARFGLVGLDWFKPKIRVQKKL